MPTPTQSNHEIKQEKDKLNPEVKYESEAEVKTETESEVNPEVKTESEAEVNPEVKYESEAEVNPEVKTETEYESESEFESESDLDDIEITINFDDPKLDVVIPDENNPFWELYRVATRAFWLDTEIDFSQDERDLSKLNSDQLEFIETVLAFFAQSDNIVNMNLDQRFSNDIEHLPNDIKKDVMMFYNFQKAIEDIHSTTYGRQLSICVPNDTRRTYLAKGLTNISSIQKKAKWCFKWIEDEKASFATRLIAFACVEGIFFCSSFCAIYWLKDLNLLPGVCKANEFIARDEGLHRDFACLLYRELKKRKSELLGDITDNKVLKIVRWAVKIEKEFVTEGLPVEMLGMNSKLMCQYVECVADSLLNELGLDKIYYSSNPFTFMDNISIVNKTNFFEHEASNYAKPDDANKENEIDMNNLHNEDF